MRRGGFLDKNFYFAMSLLIAATVAWGFGRTIGPRLIHPAIAPPWILYVHGTAFCSWVLFFILQSALIRTHNVKLHRRLGWFGLGLGCAMIILGVSTAIAVMRIRFGQTHDVGALAFRIVPFYDMVCFSTFLALAIYWRKKPEFHRRLILIASCTLTAAAFGRFPHMGPFFYPAVDVLILLGAARDWIVNRRIHQAYWYAVPAIVLGQAFTMYTVIHSSAWWLRIAQAIAS
jgi:hypothetical protein